VGLKVGVGPRLGHARLLHAHTKAVPALAGVPALGTEQARCQLHGRVSEGLVCAFCSCFRQAEGERRHTRPLPAQLPPAASFSKAGAVLACLFGREDWPCSLGVRRCGGLEEAAGARREASSIPCAAPPRCLLSLQPSHLLPSRGGDAGRRRERWFDNTRRGADGTRGDLQNGLGESSSVTEISCRFCAAEVGCSQQPLRLSTGLIPEECSTL